MRKMLVLFTSVLFITSVYAEDYNTVADFSVDNVLNFAGNSNFTDFTMTDAGGYTLGVGSVFSGLDFDGDSLYEILFSIDETLSPGGPDPGKVGVYLMEADGSGGFTHVWHWVTPEPGNSLPGLNYGDIDGDGNHEIYFGVPPACCDADGVGANDNSWGTNIFEQGADGTFPASPTLRWLHGMANSDNFRPAGYAIADVDSDGKNELVTIDRATRKMTIDALTGADLDELAGFTNEFIDETNLQGGSTYDVDVVDFDGDGHHEVWVNTWDNFSMAIFEASGADTYALSVDLNSMFSDGDPGSFNRDGFMFHDADGDSALEAWFPMTNGKLYYLETVSDSTDSAHFAIGGVDSIKASHFHEILQFEGKARGADMGDIDGDGKMDMIVSAEGNDKILRIEFQGGNPTNAFNYVVSTILETSGGADDRWYAPSISDNDLDGDGNLDIVIPNRNGSEAGQAHLVVLDYDAFTWSFDGGNAYTHLAPTWSRMAVMEKSINDSLFQTDPTGNSRTAIGGMDMDGDGALEVIVTDYAGGRVIVYEYDAANTAFDVVWSSPVVEARNHTSNPRTVNVGDLDGDGKHEIVFPSSNVDAEGYHIYEWDGVTGSDNYGTQPSSICKTEVDVCCAADDGAGFRGDHERLTIFDIDGDGQQELITAIRRGSPRGTLISSLGATDDIEHNSGGGLETWSQEFLTNSSDYGGGSPYQALPADLNGDGKNELVNHHWNNFLFYNITSTGADAYTAPDTGAAAVDAYYKATSNDQVSLFGGNAADVDGDGNDEAYFHSYGSWGVGAGDVWVVDYDSTDTDVLAINADHVHRVGNTGTFSGDIGSGYDGHDRPYIFAGRGRPNVSALEYIGPDVSTPQSYIKKDIYWGEMDVTYTIHMVDSNGVHTDQIRSNWGFPSKVQTQWGGTMLDFDGDGKNELLLSMQNVKTTLTNTNYDWNAATGQYDTTTTDYVNPKAWTVIILENSESTLSNDEPITFITPEQYSLSQNYPNPFNPNTTIEYTIPINRRVSVKIYNISGQLVRTLVNNEFMDAGKHKVMWNGKNSNGVAVSTGMYLYSLEWAGMKKVKSMTLLK
jgi:hypothetical protein